MATHSQFGYADFDDEQLLTALRNGDTEAYAELWRRHVHAALRLARRIMPSRADDLAAESFLAVYTQVHEKGNGPQKAFRAYLFTTMRNLAIRWGKDSRLVISVPEPEMFDELEASKTDSEDRAEADSLLAAFTALPSRWQRVLWMLEVDRLGRAAVATELGIRPNAVSALYRRARYGLQERWMTEQLPAGIREDPAHVARLFPALAMKKRLEHPPAHIAAHIAGCDECARLQRELLYMHKRMQRRTLAVTGIGGLAAILAVSTPHLPLAAVAVGVTSAAAVLAVAFTATFGAGILPAAAPATPPHISAAAGKPSAAPEPGIRTSGQHPAGVPFPERTDTSPAQAPAPWGRGNTNSRIPSVELNSATAPNVDWEAPAVPQRLGDVPTPPTAARSTTAANPAGETDPSLPQAPPALAIAVAHPLAAAYFAPVLTGTATPGSEVAVELPNYSAGSTQTYRFAATVTPSGSWTLDLRPLFTDKSGTFEYRAWAYSDATASAAQTGQFTVNALQVDGFDGLKPFEVMPAGEGTDTGIVFRVLGPANGQICLTSVNSGYMLTLALDGTGSLVRRLRFIDSGDYSLTFRVCDGEQIGPAQEFWVTVGPESAFTPYGVNDADGSDAASDDSAGGDFGVGMPASAYSMDGPDIEVAEP
ncbi:MAG: sigma-70 family RNA polymerase sigma factor [Pseudoclavibacter sp.]